MTTYREAKEAQQAAYNAFPIGFAFSKEQLKEEMERLKVSCPDELIRIPGGGFIRETDKEAFLKMCDDQDKIMRAYIAADPDGSGFIADMFHTELADHEYCITGDLSETLDALGMTLEEINADSRLINGLKIALKQYGEEL